MHGVMEAIYHAVPMVGMPVFIDQVSSNFYNNLPSRLHHMMNYMYPIESVFHIADCNEGYYYKYHYDTDECLQSTDDLQSNTNY